MQSKCLCPLDYIYSTAFYFLGNNLVNFLFKVMVFCAEMFSPDWPGLEEWGKEHLLECDKDSSQTGSQN